MHEKIINMQLFNKLVKYAKLKITNMNSLGHGTDFSSHNYE